MGFYCLDYFFRISPSLVLPEFMGQYHTNPFGIGLFASMFYLGYVIFQIPGGIILNHWRLIPSLVIIILLCVLSFLCFVFADHFFLGLILRLLIGITSACSFIGVLYIARKFIDNRYFTLISGITIAAGTLLASFIQVINAYLMNYLSWHLILFLFSLFGVVLAILIIFIPEKKLIPQFNLEDSQPILNLIKACCRLASNRAFFLNSLTGGLFYLPTSLLTAVWGISFFKASYNISSTYASSMIFMIFLGWAIGSPTIGLLTSQIKHPRLLTSIPALLAGISIGLVLFKPELVGHLLPLYLLCFGLFSSAQVMVWENFNHICPRALSGIGIATTNMLIMLFVAIAHPLIGYIINISYQQQSLLNSSTYLHGLRWIPGMFVLVIILAWTFNPSKIVNLD